MSGFPDIRQCKFSTYGYACGKEAYGNDFCEKHQEEKCVSCGAPATHGCDFCGQFVCGFPLCDDCIGTTDTGPSGVWGFLNHVHIRRGAKLPSQLLEEESEEEKRALAECKMVGVNQ